MEILYKCNKKIYYLDKYGTLDSKSIKDKSLCDNIPHLDNQPVLYMYKQCIFGIEETLNVVHEHHDNFVIVKDSVGGYHLDYIGSSCKKDYTESNIRRLKDENII